MPVKIFMTLFFGFLCLVWLGCRTVAYIGFDRGCGGYLKQAADASSIDLAKSCMKKAMDYIESNNMTKGFTSVVYRTPDEDLGFWYSNLSAAVEEMNKVTDSTSALEKTNILMKLRETLLDQGKGGQVLTVPAGISVYPANAGWAISAFILLAFFIVAAVAVTLESL